MNIVEYNRAAWNRQARAGCRWSEPVDAEVIRKARQGDWEIVLTPNKMVPREWFDGVAGKRVLCLASGGGQQAPVLAAAGGIVTSFDNSDEQLAKDQLVAEREALEVRIMQGDMADLSALQSGSFDLIFHPCSNGYAEDVRPVWRECARVLKPGGRLLSGFGNPLLFMFDEDEAKSGNLEVKYSLPYSDLTSLPQEKLAKLQQEGAALAFGHTLSDQIGGQIAEGFAITGFYEDYWNDEASPLNRFTPLYIATLAVKMQGSL